MDGFPQKTIVSVGLVDRPLLFRAAAIRWLPLLMIAVSITLATIRAAAQTLPGSWTDDGQLRVRPTQELPPPPQRTISSSSVESPTAESQSASAGSRADSALLHRPHFDEHATSRAVSGDPRERAARALPPPASPKTPSQREPMALPPQRGAEAPSRHSGFQALGTIAGSLAIVLTALLTVMWLLRRATPQAAQPLPTEVVEVLGRAPLSGRQQMHLLRFGRKLILVSVTPEGAKTLTEVTDPLEVDRLAGLCQQTRPNSATASFRRVFEQFAAGKTDGV